jgi:lipase chaperone LimK
VRRRAGILGGGLVLCVAGLVGFLIWRDAPAAMPTSGPSPAVNLRAGAGLPPVHVPAPATARRDVGDVAPPEALPGSLEGTEADGALEADATGHLVITIELRRLFDHFLAASGEEPIATMRGRILAVLRARLPAVAAAEAIEILDRYLAYRDAARALVPPSSEPAAGLAQVHDLRARMFSPAVAQAFFAEEEAAIYAALARRDLLADPGLPAAERERRLAEIDARAPAAVRAARAAATAPLDEMNREAALRATGASDQQIAAARTAALGADAAARLAELDRAHAAWDARLARFRAERAAVLADSRLDDAERSRRIDDLLARSFTAAERIRVEALDRLAPDPGAR